MVRQDWLVLAGAYVVSVGPSWRSSAVWLTQGVTWFSQAAAAGCPHQMGLAHSLSKPLRSQAGRVTRRSPGMEPRLRQWGQWVQCRSSTVVVVLFKRRDVSKMGSMGSGAGEEALGI